MAKKVTSNLKKQEKPAKTLTTVSSILGGDELNISPIDEEINEEISDVIEEVEEVEEILAPKVEIVPTLVKQSLVRIKPNRDHKTYIGNQWYYLSKGKITTVPQNVKDILNKAGLLDPI